MWVKKEGSLSVVYQVMTNPEIWERISEDGQDVGDFIPCEDQIYLSAWKDGELIGVARFIEVNSHLYEYHPMVLEKFRNHSVEFHDKTIQTIKNMVNGLQLISYIPCCYRDVYLFAKRNNWQISGRVTHGIKKHGELQDLHIMQYQGDLSGFEIKNG